VYEICYETHTTLPISLKHFAALPWEILKIQIFCIYSANMKETANK